MKLRELIRLLHRVTTILFAVSFDPTVSTSCEKGHALRDPVHPLIDKSCFNDGHCPVGFYCTREVCCLTPAQICSQQVAIGFTCPTTPPLTKFFFDPQTAKCTKFTYNGCFGNENSFDSEQDCESYCTKAVCPKGSPVIIGEEIYKCSPSSPCGPNYECMSSAIAAVGPVCCPMPSFICSMGPDRGHPCPGAIAIEPRLNFFYNPAKHNCETLEYLGCDGTENNFESEQSCFQFCTTPTLDAICPLGRKVAIQPGGASPQTCFLHMPENCAPGYVCTKSLGTGRFYCCSTSAMATPMQEVCPDGQAPFMPPGSLNPECIPGEPGTCPPTYTCTRLRPGTSEALCCRIDENGLLASLPAPPLVPIDACSDGLTVHVYPGQAPQTCDLPNGRNCPRGYTCTARPNGVYFCCSNKVGLTSFCNHGSSPQISDYTGSPQSCYPESLLCKPGYACQLGPLKQYYCCTNSAPFPTDDVMLKLSKTAILPPEPPAPLIPDLNTICPLGAKPQLSADSLQPLPKHCSPRTQDCDRGYWCQLGSIGSYICCSTQTGQVCPGLTVAEMIPVYDSPKPCLPEVPDCGFGFTCLRGPSGYYYCCSKTHQHRVNTPSDQSALSALSSMAGASISAINVKTLSTNYCPPKMTAFTYPGTNLPLFCDLSVVGSANQCPTNHTCTKSPKFGAFCCAPAQTVSDCPAGVPVFLPTNDPWICNNDPRVASCPSPSVCQYSKLRSLHICCVNLHDLKTPSAAGGGGRNGIRAHPDAIFDSTNSSVIFTPASLFEIPTVNVASLSSTTATKANQDTTKMIETTTPKTLTTTMATTINQATTSGSVKILIVQPETVKADDLRLISTSDVRCPRMLASINCSWFEPEACPRGFVCEYLVTRRSYHCCKQQSVSFLRRTLADATFIEDPNRPICEVVEVAIRNNETNSYSCYPLLSAGETGCVFSEQCVQQASQCVNETCVCPPNTVVYNKECVEECPEGLQNRNGFCRLNTTLTSDDLKRIVYVKSISKSGIRRYRRSLIRT